jgi:hypothetical protein
VALAFVVVAFIHGDIVPGFIYRDERAQRKIAETQAERNADAIEAISSTIKAALNDRRRDG